MLQWVFIYKWHYVPLNFETNAAPIFVEIFQKMYLNNSLETLQSSNFLYPCFSVWNFMHKKLWPPENVDHFTHLQALFL